MDPREEIPAINFKNKGTDVSDINKLLEEIQAIGAPERVVQVEKMDLGSIYRYKVEPLLIATQEFLIKTQIRNGFFGNSNPEYQPHQKFREYFSVLKEIKSDIEKLKSISKIETPEIKALNEAFLYSRQCMTYQVNEIENRAKLKNVHANNSKQLLEEYKEYWRNEAKR